MMFGEMERLYSANIGRGRYHFGGMLWARVDRTVWSLSKVVVHLVIVLMRRVARGSLHGVLGVLPVEWCEEAGCS